ncbi:MAG: aminoglycoside adenylyltransferase domain-containing protein [Candidatus Baltobacteraceae bacterium]
MNAVRARGIGDADRDVRQYVIRTASVLGEVLSEAMTGLYLYGSLATGAFFRERSSIDLLAGVRKTLDPHKGAQLANAARIFSQECPVPGGLSLIVLEQSTAQACTHPARCELRCDRTHGAGAGIAARVMETRERGFRLVGPPAGDFFGPVPWYAFTASLQEAFAAPQTDPVCAVLDACRVFAAVTARVMHMPNKPEAAQTALIALPAVLQTTVRDALNVATGVKAIDDVVFGRGAIAQLRAYVCARVTPAFERALDCEEDE